MSRASRLSELLDIPLIQTNHVQDVATPYALCFSGRETELRSFGKGAANPVSASFLSGKNDHRRKFGGGKGQLIAKAVGMKPGIYPRVLDATAGLGRDSFVLASLGCEVQMLEQSPIISELVFSALERAEHSEIEEIISRMSLKTVNSAEWLRAQPGFVADVIYLDPMYPHRDKSSLVKKEMRIFRDIVGEDMDSHLLLEHACEKAEYRVVVKRPRKGESIQGPKPTYQLAGKSSRYDIYARKSLDALKAPTS